jgi:hypothetical protein
MRLGTKSARYMKLYEYGIATAVFHIMPGVVVVIAVGIPIRGA